MRYIRKFSILILFFMPNLFVFNFANEKIKNILIYQLRSYPENIKEKNVAIQYESLINKLESVKIRVELVPRYFSNEKVSKNIDLIITGYFRENSLGNLEFFIQLIDAKNNTIINAFAVKDNPILLQKDLNLDPKEIKVPDEIRIRNYQEKLYTTIVNNRVKYIREDNIKTNYLEEEIPHELSLPGGINSNDEVLSTFKYIDEQEVVTATRDSSRVKDSPAIIYVVTADEIKTRGYRTLVDALKDLPGFDFQHTYGVYPDLFHQRGLVGNIQRTLLYIDGVPDNNIYENAILGGSVRFPLYNIERIEVISGPASALYGANAFNGLINIITKSGTKGNKSSIQGTYGTIEKNDAYAGNLSAYGEYGKIKYGIGATYLKSEGPNFSGIQKLERSNQYNGEFYNNKYDPIGYFEKKACGGSICNPDGSSVGYYSSPTYNNSREDTYNINAKFEGEKFRFQTVNWQYNAGSGNFGNGTKWSDTEQRGLETNVFDTRNNFRRWGIYSGILKNGEVGLLGATWNTRNNSILMGYNTDYTKSIRSESELIVRHTDLLPSSREAYPNTEGPSSYFNPGGYSVTADYSRSDKSYQAEQRIVHTPNTRIKNTVGILLRIFDASKDYGSYERYVYKNYASYYQMVYKFNERFSLVLGSRYDIITRVANVLNPRISAIYRISDSVNLKLLGSTAFREPSGEELYSLTPQRKPNPGLKPESLRSFELGLGYRSTKYLYLELNSYYNSISNLILEVQTPDNLPIQGSQPSGTSNWNQYQNIGNAKIYGLETRFNFNISPQFIININYTYNKGNYYNLPKTLEKSPSVEGRPGDNPGNDFIGEVYRQLLNKESVPEKGAIPNIATHKIYFGATYTFLNTNSVYMGINFIDIRRTIPTNPERSIPGYAFLKMNFRIENFLGKELFLNVLVNNALNQQFFDPGIRTADGNFYSTQLPIEKRNIWITLGKYF